MKLSGGNLESWEWTILPIFLMLCQNVRERFPLDFSLYELAPASWLRAPDMQPSGFFLPWERMHQLSLQQGHTSVFRHHHKLISWEQLRFPSGISQMGLPLSPAEGCLPPRCASPPPRASLSPQADTCSHSPAAREATSHLCTLLGYTHAPAEPLFSPGADLLGCSAAAGLQGSHFVSSHGACLWTVASGFQAVLTHEGWQAQPARTCVS